MKKLGSNIWLIISTCIAVIAVVSTIVLSVNYVTEQEKSDYTINAYKTAYENRCQDSLHELIDSVNNMEVNLSKLTITQSSARQQELLTKTAMLSENAETNASVLPLFNEEMAKTLKFINQVGDYSQSLLKKINGGNTLTDADKELIGQLYTTISALKTNLTELYDKVKDISLSEILGYESGKNPDVIVGDGFSMNDETFDYPQLIYDGPFSDAIEKTQPQSLGGKKYSVSELKNKLSAMLSDYNIQNIEYVSSINSDINLIVFNVTTNSGEIYNINITEEGGYLCQMNSYTLPDDYDNPPQELSAAESIEIAESFVSKMGFDAEAVWVSRTIDGYTYVNLCPVKNGIIIYPDLIKVTIDTVRGKAIGIEAYAYLLNHHEREVTVASGQADKAQQKISADLTVEKVSVAVIPKNNKEILCYEFKCTDGANEYFVYVNAETFVEEEILRVIRGTEGYTVI